MRKINKYTNLLYYTKFLILIFKKLIKLICKLGLMYINDLWYCYKNYIMHITYKLEYSAIQLVAL